MHDILRDRVWRKLQSLPQDQLYQVLDYIEFLEGKYAREQAVKADPIQKFAERLEDGMRFRSVAPRVITGTVGLLGTARRVLRTVSDAGREILDASQPTASQPPSQRTTRAVEPRPAGNGTGLLPPPRRDEPRPGSQRSQPPHSGAPRADAPRPQPPGQQAPTPEAPTPEARRAEAPRPQPPRPESLRPEPPPAQQEGEGTS